LAESEELAVVGGPFDHFEVVGEFAAIVTIEEFGGGHLLTVFVEAEAFGDGDEGIEGGSVFNALLLHGVAPLAARVLGLL
jgi:hypothetical protein